MPKTADDGETKTETPEPPHVHEYKRIVDKDGQPPQVTEPTGTHKCQCGATAWA